MRKDHEESCSDNSFRRNFKCGIVPKKINNLFGDLVEKEEEILVYKERLKELETAFYYNLEIISERDLELSVLEKQLNFGNEQLQTVLQDKEELEEVLKKNDKMNSRKIQQLEILLSQKEREIRALREENILSKRLSTGKERELKRITQLGMKFESEKKKLIETYREEIEERDRYYLLEIDNLNGKLEEMRRDKIKMKKTDEENINLKRNLASLEKLLRERENIHSNYVGNFQTKAKVDKEVQCQMNAKVADKTIQARAAKTDAETQVFQSSETENFYRKKLTFYQEQNEVLKCIIKDLKKNKETSETPETGTVPEKCSDCESAKFQIKVVDEKFQQEINNIKRILFEETSQRAEEEIILQSLEKNMKCLKGKIMLANPRVQPHLKDKYFGIENDDRGIRDPIDVSHIEEKLSKKFDLLLSEVHEEREKFNEKLEELKQDCLGRMEKALLKPRNLANGEEENLLEKIRMEMAKLENKIENDMKNMARNNFETDKFDKNRQIRNTSRDPPFTLPNVNYFDSLDTRRIPFHQTSFFCNRNDISFNKFFKIPKLNEKPLKLEKHFGKVVESHGDSSILKTYANEFARGR